MLFYLCTFLLLPTGPTHIRSVIILISDHLRHQGNYPNQALFRIIALTLSYKFVWDTQSGMSILCVVRSIKMLNFFKKLKSIHEKSTVSTACIKKNQFIWQVPIIPVQF